jgi:hypothetical protein
MKNSNADRIRNALKHAELGRTVAQIAMETKVKQEIVRVTLNTMPDAYIAWWTSSPAGLGYRAVWCVVEVPENAPMPRNVPRPSPDEARVRAYKNKVMEKHRYNKKLKAMALPEDDEPAPAQPVPSDRPRTVWQPVAPWPTNH